ncbi:hypothetical protein [Moraxella catarrhalis]|uniref:hypothetical protein n=1 Tax=Moraxella catarrhalis TaxID=480 RepID=UPI00128CD2B3|nr:hypothetical protein [Moraxella catarrhalis]MPW68390.1 hypothetical protein [Moraxella catarrhalis]MPX57058.1 hypothetical protein [Moraxella catarrhalis]
MKRLVTAISTLVQVYKPSTLDADYIKISFKYCNELSRVSVGFSNICLRKSVSTELAKMSASQIKRWIERYFASFVGKGYCQIVRIDIGVDHPIQAHFKKHLEGKIYLFDNC